MKSKVKIRTKEKCPACGGNFDHFPRLGFICKKCKTHPKKFFIDINYNGQRVKVYSTAYGHILDSYNLALETSHYIATEIKDGLFDVTKYYKKAQSEYYMKSRLLEYLDKKTKTIAPSYLKTFENHINTAIKYFGNTDVREVRKLHLIKFKEFLEGRNLSNKTVKNYLDTLKAFFNYLKKELDLIYEIPQFPAVEVTDPGFRWVSTETQAKIFEAIPDEDKPIFAFIMLTGCRPGEARALKVRDIDLENHGYTIHSTFSKNVIRDKRKGKKSKPVTNPIHEELYPLLVECVKDKTPESFVFINPRMKRPYSEDSLLRIWHNVKKKLNLDERLRLYDVTRHSLASNLLNKGVSIAKISKLLGHTNIKTTERYAHVDINSLRVDISKISILQFKKEKNKDKEAVESH